MKRKTQRRKGPRLRRNAFCVSTFADMDQQDRAYWMQQTPQARLRAMELMRRINYGKAATERLQRVFEIVQSETA